MTEPVPPGFIIGPATARQLASKARRPGGPKSGRQNTEITRRTFIAWRRVRGFPEPFLTVEGMDLYDARAVRAWVREQRQNAARG